MPDTGSMGFIFADVILRGPGGSRTMRMLVDTGSTYTWVPEGIARELGALERGVAHLRTADNRIVDRILGELEIEILGRRGTRFIVFALEGEEPLLGTDTLEGLLIVVDPVERTLKRVDVALAL